MLCGQAFAFINVEDIVIAQERDFPDFAALFVFLLNPFPENNHLSFRAFLDAASGFLTLLKGEVFAGFAEQHLIEEAVGFAGCVGYAIAARNPRLLPRDCAFFHFSDKAICDFLINVHFLLPFSCGSKEVVVEYPCSRIL